MASNPKLVVRRRGTAEKPEYLIPSMAEIATVPWNGFNVVSTFSGCGGSCLGYRMAGFRVLWANEFVPAAQEVYKLNHPGSVLDGRDIRLIRPEDILAATGLAPGAVDLFDGSPPCASFSMSGKREGGWGKIRDYSETKQRVDDLFFEYARILRGLRPKVFVAENVSGLVKGVSKGYFKDILQELKSCGYTVEAKVLDAQWLGVPQMRARIIFQGVREDLSALPSWPVPLPYRYTVRDALPWVFRHGTAPTYKKWAPNVKNPEKLMVDSAMEPAPTITTCKNRGSGTVKALKGTGKDRTERIPECTCTEEQIRRRLIHDTSGERGMGDVTDRPCPTITVGVNSLCSYHFKVEETHEGKHLTDDLVDGGAKDADMTGTAIGREYDKLGPGQASERYFNLVRPSGEKPCPTVTQLGGLRGAASVTHPTERRKFTIPELKRICAFPDDFVLVGAYAQQWERLGRAVPPVMMAQLAVAIRDGVLRKLSPASG